MISVLDWRTCLTEVLILVFNCYLSESRKAHHIFSVIYYYLRSCAYHSLGSTYQIIIYKRFKAKTNWQKFLHVSNAICVILHHYSVCVGRKKSPPRGLPHFNKRFYMFQMFFAYIIYMYKLIPYSFYEIKMILSGDRKKSPRLHLSVVLLSGPSGSILLVFRTEYRFWMPPLNPALGGSERCCTFHYL